jgi:hypothetical protein
MRALNRKSSIRMVTIDGLESPIGPGSTVGAVTIVDAPIETTRGGWPVRSITREEVDNEATGPQQRGDQ